MKELQFNDHDVVKLNFDYSAVYQASYSRRMFKDDCNVFIEINHKKVLMISYDMTALLDLTIDQVISTFTNKDIDSPYDLLCQYIINSKDL